MQSLSVLIIMLDSNSCPGEVGSGLGLRLGVHARTRTRTAITARVPIHLSRDYNIQIYRGRLQAVSLGYVYIQ